MQTMNSPVLADIEDKYDLEFNYANPREHVPDIKRGNRTLEERFRVQFYRLPFKALPRVMIRYLPLRITKNRSLFPKKEGISKYFSPHVLLKRQQVDYNKEFQFHTKITHRHRLIWIQRIPNYLEV